MPDYTPDAETGSRHAVVTVERTEAANADEDTVTADAFAQFVRVSAQAEPSKVLSSTGIVRTVPTLDHCASSEEFEELSGPLATLGPVEFLEAGDVTIAAERAVTRLAAHAFPTVSDFASGVVYTSRDLSAEPLPAGASYVITTTGSTAVSPIRVRGDAPTTPDQVTVNGVPLFELSEVSVADPIDLTWAVGDATDIVYAEISMSQGGPSYLCTFRDETGAGTIPAELLTSAGSGRISLHRTRIQTFERAGFDTAELRFDFQKVASVEFID